VILLSAEETEGFPKRGTTLEGRVAQLFRLMGYKVSRNIFLEDHEIDVYAESEDGKKIIVECKEYYNQLINRDLILIFATKTRDINPDEAWFVTIYDFEPSALELCKRYGIRAINGYDLEELEEKAAKGPIKLGPVPPENRLLRILNRQRINLKRKRKNIERLKKVAEEIKNLRGVSLDLPPFLFPMYPNELKRKNIWLKELDTLPKASKYTEGKLLNKRSRITDLIVNIDSLPPKLRGFRVLEETQVKFAFVISALLLFFAVIVIASSYASPISKQFTPEFSLFGMVLLLIGLFLLALYKKIVWNRTNTFLIKNAIIREGSLEIPENPISLVNMHGDVATNRLYKIPSILSDGSILGYSKDFILERASMNIIGMKLELIPEIAEETGFTETVIPINNMQIYSDQNKINIRINAIYVLSETFLEEESIE